MNKDPSRAFSAKLYLDEKVIEVKIYRGSKYSIIVDFAQKNLFRDGTIFSMLSIDFNDKIYEIPNCLFILERGEQSQFSGSLIFKENLYDFDFLFFNDQIVDLNTIANDRELLMIQKDEIKESFKTYTANLTYDMELFRQFFNNMDKQLAREPDYVKEYAINTLLSTEGAKFISFLKEQQIKLEKEITNFTRTDHVNHGYYFRTQIRHIIDQSDILMMTNDKPRGYIGDSEMMNMIYKGGYVGETSFSKVLYKFSIDHDAALAVRNRRNVITSKIKDIYSEKNKKGKNNLRIMSVACGPFYELEDFFTDSIDLIESDFVLLDQDDLAIKDAKNTIQQVEKRIGLRLSVQFLQDSIRTVISDKNLTDKIGKFDFIYSMGLFDYLTPLVAKIIMKKLFSLLSPGGTILIGNYHYKNPSRYYMEYWHDWVLYYRDEDDFKQLIDGLEVEDYNIDFEESKSQMFLTAIKDNK